MFLLVKVVWRAVKSMALKFRPRLVIVLTFVFDHSLFFKNDPLCRASRQLSDLEFMS